MVIVTALLFLLLFFSFRYVPALTTPGINPWYPSFAFSLKIATGFLFLYIYSEVYGKGALSADAGAFMTESKILNRVFYTSPVDYIRLLFGLGDQEKLVQTYLQETYHWDKAAQSIISDNRNILRVHSVIHFFSRGYTPIHMLVMSFFAMVGLKQLYTAIVHNTNTNRLLIYLSLLLLPSILFWTSSILKEPLMYLGLGLFVRGLIGKDPVRKKWTLLSLGLILLLSFKPYVLISLFPGIALGVLYYYLPNYKLAWSLGISVIIASVTFALLPKQRDALVHTLSHKQHDFNNVGKGGIHALSDSCFYFFPPEQMHELVIEGDSVSIKKEMDVLVLLPGEIGEPHQAHLTPDGQKWFIYFINEKSDGYIPLTPIGDSFAQLIKNIPEALINSLFRPFINDPGSWLKYPAIFEVYALFGFLAFAIVRRRKLDTITRSIILGGTAFILSLSLLIGWITPVLGAIVRYRIPTFLAILIIALLIVQPIKKHKNG